MFPH
jgi:hypothetical protein